ncbi:MAG TPA: ABC transporter permease [Chitinophagaceae bacterium]|jgi:ABC-type antimicrobial peptide transport system permease subunit|nr:ABC transporter permease [Chitinophagaceae bacterium]
MIKNYFKIAWRNIINNKVYSAINIFGLAIGMAVTLIIALWVYQEFSYNRFLPNYKTIYQVRLNHNIEGSINTMNTVSLPLGDVLRKEIPEIKYVAETDWNDNHSLMVGETKLYLKGMRTGNDFLKIFQYPFVKGNGNAVLNDPYSIVLTESTAKSLFGNNDAINKTVRYNNKYDLKVEGILKDLPSNSSLQFKYLIPFSFREQTTDWVKDARTQWGNNSFQTFVALQPGISYAQVEPKIRNIVKTNSEMKKTEVMLHPLKDWELYSNFENGKATGGFIEYVKMFSIIGLLVLLIACINFTNLSTARSEKRAREVGVRKTIGSSRQSLIIQFLSESVLVSFIAFLISILLVQLALPYFNQLTKGWISTPYSSPVFWMIMIAFVLITGLLAGSRPAFYFSSFIPVKVLKGTVQTGRSAAWSRKILVVLQFSCSIALIISTVIIYRQIGHTKDRSTGYNQDRLMMTDMSADLNRNYKPLKQDLLQSGVIENVARASSPATGIYSLTIIGEWPGKAAGQESLNTGAISVSENYFQTLGISVKAGRDFSDEWKIDSGSVIVNEAALKKMGLKDPLNQFITWNGNERARIIGVVKDAIMESPFTPVRPTVFTHGREGNSLMYRLSKNISTKDAITKLTTIFNKYNPAYPYSYQFVDEEYANKFNLELLIGKLAGLFAAFAIFISCLGLFGLAAYMAEQRNKEIGIRKVLGASVSQVWLLLSKDFIVLIILSCAIASPVAFYYLQSWLQKYDYRVTISPFVFIVAAIAAILITIVTISFQALKAALANPVKSLRSE